MHPLEQAITTRARNLKSKKIVKFDEDDEIFLHNSIKWCNGKVVFSLQNGEYIVTNHVLERFRIEAPKTTSLNNLKDINDPRMALIHLFRQFSTSREMERRNTLRQILEHKFKISRYYYGNEMIYTVEEDKPRNILVTCYIIDLEKRKSLYRLMEGKINP